MFWKKWLFFKIKVEGKQIDNQIGKHWFENLLQLEIDFIYNVCVDCWTVCLIVYNLTNIVSKLNKKTTFPQSLN